MKHRTGDGRVILISDMSDLHLINTIRLYKNKAKKGILLRSGGGSCAEDFWYDEDLLLGEEAEEYLNLKAYTEELYRRGLEL